MGWWGNWRQSLPTHIGNLQATDLLDCTSIVLGQPVNTAITGAQIIAGASSGAVWGGITGTLSSQADLQTALLARPTFTMATGVNVTGIIVTTLSASISLPANTFQASVPKLLHIKARGRRVSGVGGVIVYGVSRNTTATAVGATLIGQQSLSISNTIGMLERHLFWDGSTLSVQFPGTLTSDLINNGTYTSTAITTTIINHLVFTIQNVSLTDVAKIDFGVVQIF